MTVVTYLLPEGEEIAVPDATVPDKGERINFLRRSEVFAVGQIRRSIEIDRRPASDSVIVCLIPWEDDA